jgi:predicted DNA-binding transcriptional regulator AlpA
MSGDSPKSVSENRPLEQGFVRLPEILAIYPVGRSTWWAGVRAGRYPAPVKLGARITAWRRADILALIERVSASGRQ